MSKQHLYVIALAGIVLLAITIAGTASGSRPAGVTQFTVEGRTIMGDLKGHPGSGARLVWTKARSGSVLVDGIQHRDFTRERPNEIHVRAVTDQATGRQSVFVEPLGTVQTTYHQPNALAGLMNAPDQDRDCLGKGDVIEREEYRFGQRLIVIRTPPTKDRIIRVLKWPDAGCVQVGSYADWLDPQTGELVSTTIDEPTSIRVGRPDPKLVAMDTLNYREQSLKEAELAYHDQHKTSVSACRMKRIEKTRKEGDPWYAVHRLPLDQQKAKQAELAAKR